jgi:hypothetical protein
MGLELDNYYSGKHVYSHSNIFKLCFVHLYYSAYVISETAEYFLGNIPIEIS